MPKGYPNDPLTARKPGVKPRPAAERFWAKVDKTDTCWLWTAGIASTGYGIFHLPNPERQVLAHRYAYESCVGPIPAGLHVDHLCRVRHCVNPAHLEPVTPRENTLRGVGISAQRARQTHCVHGHPFAGDNLALVKGGRGCRTCNREHCRQKRSRLRGEPG